jgi:hypothetical protein
MFEGLLDQRIPGGCDDCDAYQELTTDGSGVYMLAIRHDNTCPWLAQHDHQKENTP